MWERVEEQACELCGGHMSSYMLLRLLQDAKKNRTRGLHFPSWEVHEPQQARQCASGVRIDKLINGLSGKT